jgi:NodT family efflux transporter outer membrane factor (OMF) lipoprotein
VALETAQANLIGAGVARAQYAHAIAVLVGKNPEELDIPQSTSMPSLPDVPVAVPSTLLQRRPDIAAAERRSASASAQIGVQEAAWFPNLTLNASYGFSAATLGKLLNVSSSVWSYGASATQTLFDAGATNARVSQARSAYDQSVAEYRQTVLAAFQDVEDQLAAQRILAVEEGYRRQSADAGQQAATMVLNQYKAGQVAYTDVVTAQATALTARRSVVQATAVRQTTAVALVQALGGGWTAPF